MIRYIIPSVGSGLKLERHCPHCGRFGGNIHSGINYRAVSDIKISSIDGTSLRNDGWAYVYYNDKTVELYDMKKDPEQFHNQANNPEYKDIRKEMHKQLQATLITADLRAPALQP